MREILFRGKENPSGKWVEGFLVGRCHIGDWVTCTPVHSKTVGQYTGLTDKNGKKIFEGDILASDSVGEDFFTGEENCAQRDIFSVVWHNGEWAAYIGVIRLSDGKKEIFGICEDCGLSDELNSGNYIVVGNIHDNPELL